MTSFPSPQDDLPATDGFPFEVERAFAHVNQLCHPRRVGTEGERHAARYVAGTLRGHGLHLVRQPFGISPLRAEAWSRVGLTLCALLIVAGSLTAPVYPLLASLIWAGAALLINRAWRIFSGLGRHRPGPVVCENLLAHDDSAAEAPARVVFMAHYDTKSQFVPTGIRVGLVTAGSVMCGIMAVLALIAFLAGFAPSGLWHISAPAVVLLACLIANYTGNRSPGALDNGSGVGVLLELARAWRPQANTPLEVVWVATAAEEAGLHGARHFLHRHAHWWREKPTLLINLESVGAGPCVYLAGEHRAVRLAEDVAAELQIAYARLHVLGAGMDHEPFAARDLESISILGDVVRRSFRMHSARDDMELIDRAALERAARLAGQLAWTWAELHVAKGPISSSIDIGFDEEDPFERSAIVPSNE